MNREGPAGAGVGGSDPAEASSHEDALSRKGTPSASGRWGVLAAAVVLVLAVWTALWLAGRSSSGAAAGGDGTAGAGQRATAAGQRATALGEGAATASEGAATASEGATAGAAARVELPDELPGFRAGLFYLPDDSLLGFVEIPAGPFVMGSDPGVDSLAFDIEWWGEGRVQAAVELPRFFLARYETTVAQYAAFVRAAGHPVPDRRTLRAPPTHPVTFVAWTDAVAYARWLDAALRDAPHTPSALKSLLDGGWRVSLPTEAQWEKAGRGIDARIYPWGDSPSPDRANFRSASTAPVGSFDCPGCAHGLADMAGNVWEWTRSPYQPYPYDEADDRESVAQDALWVMRGGSFQDTEQLVRAANRGGADPGARRAFIGFRVGLTR